MFYKKKLWATTLVILLGFLFFFIKEEKKTSTQVSCLSRQDPEPFTKIPDSEMQKRVEEDLLYYFEDRRISKESSKGLYVTAILSIARGDLPEAKNQLIKSLQADPHFLAPKLQLAYVYLWLGKLQQAFEFLEAFNDICPCQELVYSGFLELADEWAKSATTRNKSIEIYRKLLHCRPEQTEYMYQLGSLLLLEGKEQEGETVLKKNLEIDPRNADAGMRLGYLYLQQGRLEESRAIFMRFCEQGEAMEGLGSIANREGNKEEAECWYRKALEGGSDSEVAEQSLAKILSSNLRYTEAAAAYETLLQDHPENQMVRMDLLEARQHIQPALLFNTRFTQSIENDPTLKAPVVRDVYLNTDAILQVPIFDSWRVDFRGYWGLQKEKNIYIPTGGINYKAAISGGGIYSRFFFLENWTWNLFSTVRRAWGMGFMNFPFQKTTQLQPGSYLLYHSDAQLFSMGAYVDSFLIKNFANVTSELLKTKSMDVRYAYEWQSLFRPTIGGSAEKMFIDSSPHNQKHSQSIWLAVGAPYIEESLIFNYLFEHKAYDKIDENYYSFKQQWKDTFGLTLYQKMGYKLYAQMTYEWGWQKSRNLLMPIGDFIFVAPLQILTSNKIIGILGFHFVKGLKVEFSTHYFKSTLPYQEWNFAGNVLWSF